MAWDYRRYGSAIDPIHKSALNDITGDWGCPTRYRYQRDAEASGTTRDVMLAPVRGDAACGTATHETVARALNNPVSRDRILTGPGAVSAADIRRVLVHELESEIGPRRVEWYDNDRDTMIADRVAMIVGLFDNMYKYVAEVVLVEPAFVMRIGTHWLQGHIDLVYRPRGAPIGEVALADWKTGAMRPDQIELDHGWEAGIYSTALHSGYLLPREALAVTYDVDSKEWTASLGMFAVTHPSKYIAERMCSERALTGAAVAMQTHGNASLTSHLRTLGRFPSEIYHVHLADYVPYKRAGKKKAERPEDLKFYQRSMPGQVAYVAGDTRGPAWLPVKISEHDIPRVEHRLRNIVGMIRMGRFIDQVGDRCKRCPFAKDCLTTGYALRGDEAKAVERVLKGVDADSAAELDVDRD